VAEKRRHRRFPSRYSEISVIWPAVCAAGLTQGSGPEPDWRRSAEETTSRMAASSESPAGPAGVPEKSVSPVGVAPVTMERSTSALDSRSPEAQAHNITGKAATSRSLFHGAAKTKPHASPACA